MLPLVPYSAQRPSFADLRHQTGYGERLVSGAFQTEQITMRLSVSSQEPTFDMPADKQTLTSASTHNEKSWIRSLDSKEMPSFL
jgi:hypothetical protein